MSPACMRWATPSARRISHGATAEAEVAAANATGNNEEMQDYSLIPRVVFTFPEVASVGKTEEKCQAAGMDIAIGKGFDRANGRPLAENDLYRPIPRRPRQGHQRACRHQHGRPSGDRICRLCTHAPRHRRARPADHLPPPTASETLEDAVHEALGQLLLEEC